jgi:hypothetical protein
MMPTFNELQYVLLQLGARLSDDEIRALLAGDEIPLDHEWKLNPLLQHTTQPAVEGGQPGGPGQLVVQVPAMDRNCRLVIKFPPPRLVLICD